MPWAAKDEAMFEQAHADLQERNTQRAMKRRSGPWLFHQATTSWSKHLVAFSLFAMST